MSLSTDSTTTTTVMAIQTAHPQSQSQHVHKRRSSKDSDEELLATATSTSQKPPSPHISPRTRMLSVPNGNFQHARSINVADSQSHGPSRPILQRPPGLGTPSPVRTSFLTAPPPNGIQNNGHSRARSISTFGYIPHSPSPLSASFPINHNAPLFDSSSRSKIIPPRMQASFSAPQIEGSTTGNGIVEPLKQQISQTSHRSHNRIHSRNLSIFFPRPGSLPTSSISELEDGTQELSIPVYEESDWSTESRKRLATNATAEHTKKPLTPLGQGFKFGSKPPPSALSTEFNTTQNDRLHSTTPPLTVTRTRRGHHHKHSLSHSFFSFLEPGSTSITSNSSGTSPDNDTNESELHTQPIPVPVSSWETGKAPLISHDNGNGYGSLADDSLPLVVYPTLAQALSITNLSLGATLWVRGQQVGSLACTGLGYWVVFDAIGLALRSKFRFGLGSIVSGTAKENNLLVVNDKDREMIRRPYGVARLSTVLTFAQSVYLMFSAVYVCKEAIEHVLLSAGEAQGNHHHTGDESTSTGLELPLTLISVTFLSLLGSALVFDNNSEIANMTHSRIPTLPKLLHAICSFRFRSNSNYNGSPRTRVMRTLTNPFVLSPLSFCAGILVISILVSHSHQRLTDLILASLLAVITFNLSYRACVILGTVLLQTSPARAHFGEGRAKMSRKEGQMEAFLRAMREIERHPHVLHLPAPHIWQIAPDSSNSTSSNLVVTVELHVRAELGDEDVLELMRWAWERIVNGQSAFSTRKSPKASGRKVEGKGKWMDGQDVDGGPEVTVGIVRG